MEENQTMPQESAPEESAPQQNTPTEAPPQNAQPSGSTQPEPAKKSSSGCMIVGIILGIIVLLGIIIVIFVFVAGKTVFKGAVDEINSVSSVTVTSTTVTSTNTTTTGTGKATTTVPSGVDAAQLDEFITSSLKNSAAPGIEDVKVSSKLYYTDSAGTIWLKYVATPVPVNAADPVTGVMKKVKGSDWAGVDYGTAGLGASVPSDVAAALELND